MARGPGAAVGLLLLGLGLALAIIVPAAVVLSRHHAPCGPPRFAHAAVAADAKVCSDIGRAILQQGGSPVDAAIAALVCTGAVNPQSMGLGGGVIFTVYNASTGQVEVINARETVPARPAPGLLDQCEQALPLGTGAQWAGVPGELRGYAEAHRRHGRLPWARLFQPTIALLRGGPRTPAVLSQFLRHGLLRPALAASSLRHPPLPQAALLQRVGAPGPSGPLPLARAGRHAGDSGPRGRRGPVLGAAGPDAAGGPRPGRQPADHGGPGLLPARGGGRPGRAPGELHPVLPAAARRGRDSQPHPQRAQRVQPLLGVGGHARGQRGRVPPPGGDAQVCGRAAVAAVGPSEPPRGPERLPGAAGGGPGPAHPPADRRPGGPRAQPLRPGRRLGPRDRHRPRVRARGRRQRRGRHQHHQHALWGDGVLAPHRHPPQQRTPGSVLEAPARPRGDPAARSRGAAPLLHGPLHPGQRGPGLHAGGRRGRRGAHRLRRGAGHREQAVARPGPGRGGGRPDPARERQGPGGVRAPLPAGGAAGTGAPGPAAGEEAVLPERRAGRVPGRRLRGGRLGPQEAGGGRRLLRRRLPGAGICPTGPCGPGGPGAPGGRPPELPGGGGPGSPAGFSSLSPSPPFPRPPPSAHPPAQGERGGGRPHSGLQEAGGPPGSGRTSSHSPLQCTGSAVGKPSSPPPPPGQRQCPPPDPPPPGALTRGRLGRLP